MTYKTLLIVTLFACIVETCDKATEKLLNGSSLTLKSFSYFGLIITYFALLNRMMQFLALLDKGSQTKVKVIITFL